MGAEPRDANGFTAVDLQLMAFIREDERRKKLAVSPKLELARNFPGNIIGAKGGRSAGAKTTGIISLNVQESHREYHRVVGLRETYVSLEESMYQAVREAVDYLEYPGWRFPMSQGYAESPVGSKWVFRGMSNLRAARATKGLQGFDRFIADEASDLSGASIDVLLPTVMKVRGSKFFFAFNPNTETDPIFTKVWRPYENDPSALLLDMKPGIIDNPWFNEESQKMSDKLKAEDPELWEHVWGGQPLSQGQRSVLARVGIRAAMEREVEPGNPEEIGIDVARFGDDKTTFFRRRGMKVVEFKEVAKMDTQEVARIGWDMARRDPKVPIKVDDSGVGCITAKTKVLTPTGWVMAPDVKVGMEIYSRDSNGEVTTETVRGVRECPDVRVLSRDGYEFSFSHILPYRTRRDYPEKQTSWENILERSVPYVSTDFRYSSAHVDFELCGHTIEMPNGGTKIVRSPMTINGTDFCSFLGWFLSEGHLDGGTIGITQKKTQNFPEIMRVMSIFGSAVTQKKGAFTISNVTLAGWLRENAYQDGGGFFNIKVPRFVANNSPRNIDAFLDAFVLGDGYRHKGERIYVTSGRWMPDDLMELVMKVGRTASIRVKNRAGSIGKIQGREFTRTVDSFLISEFKTTQDNGTRAVRRSEVITTMEPVYELSLTGPSKLFLTMCPNKRPIWTHNGGVTDKLRDLGANVVPINFGGTPNDKEKYTSVADEMWFTFPIDDAQIPNDDKLMEELGGRQYKYTSKDQRKIEPKDEFKKRMGRSPDRADGLILCFYNPKIVEMAWAF